MRQLSETVEERIGKLKPRVEEYSIQNLAENRRKKIDIFLNDR